MKSRSKAILWVLLVFLVGVVFGGTLTFLGVQARLSEASDSPGWRHETRSKQPPERSVNHLAELLDLDASQKSELRRILEQSRQHFLEANREAKKQSRAIRLETRKQIRAILQPAQIAAFEEFLKEKEHDRQRHRREKDVKR
ncbi:hypothetical protein MYX65_04085 [Acidobacteria bacterium AH-259-L09]|nr:hypothetical protein [Acidobacteria bacterium AH-259-L09]